MNRPSASSTTQTAWEVSPTHLTDSSGLLVQSYTYDAFGNLLASSGPLTQPYTFTAREFDPESGLFYYRARYYDPSLGRFLSEDPISAQMRVSQSFNEYVYALNSPTNFTDALGLNPTLRFIRRFLLGRLGGVLSEIVAGTRELSDEDVIQNVPRDVVVQAQVGNPGGDDDGDGIPNNQDPRPFQPDLSIGPAQGAAVCLFRI